MNEAHCIDCMEAMLSYHDKQFDLAVVDPMYGIGENGAKARSRCNLAAGPKYKPVNDVPPGREYFDELFRVSKNQIIWGANHFIASFAKNSSCWIVWDKVNGKSPYADCELAWTSFPGSVKQIEFMWSGMMQGKSLEDGRTMQGNKKLNEKRIHPCQKPVALYSWIFEHFAKPGDIILDTHLGSGSSRIAAFKAGLDFVGIEIDRDYYLAQNERFEKWLKEV